MADFIAEGKRRSLNIASTNPGSAVSFFDLARLTGMQMTYVQIRASPRRRRRSPAAISTATPALRR
ncbi:hypothetical protein ACFQU2_11810 [Siccirubricoccus deserti]